MSKRPAFRQPIAKGRGSSPTATMGRGVLGIYDPFVAGELVMRNIRAREMAMALRKEPIIHVKDGKALTPEGAKMLGVPWLGA